MAIFNSYVKLPEGNILLAIRHDLPTSQLLTLRPRPGPLTSGGAESAPAGNFQPGGPPGNQTMENPL